jgi:hypothetical protein
MSSTALTEHNKQLEISNLMKDRHAGTYTCYATVDDNGRKNSTQESSKVTIRGKKQLNTSCFAHIWQTGRGNYPPLGNIARKHFPWFVHLWETWLGNYVSWFVHLWETWLGNYVFSGLSTFEKHG